MAKSIFLSTLHSIVLYFQPHPFALRKANLYGEFLTTFVLQQNPEPLETLLQIANEKECGVNEVNAFVDIDNDIAIIS